MMRIILGAVALTSCGLSAFAADSAPEPLPKGTVCFSHDMRTLATSPLSCVNLGKFSSVAALYERGYRVVSATYGEPQNVGLYTLIVEQIR